MSDRHTLRDDQWEKIKDILPGKATDPGRTGEDNRRFVDAVMWLGRTGAPWRDLPPEKGKWATVHKRFIRWSTKGIWQMIFSTLAVDADIREMGAEPVIPPRCHRLSPREYDKDLYKERNNIERMFGRFKHFRRVATRYDKLASSYLSFVVVAAIYLWLK